MQVSVGSGSRLATDRSTVDERVANCEQDGGGELEWLLRTLSQHLNESQQSPLSVICDSWPAEERIPLR
jgi:hypothetical protein